MRNANSGWFAKAVDAPRDIAALAVFRILIGSLMCFGAIRFMSRGWIERLYLDPVFYFKYWGFEWVVVPGETGLYLLFSAIAVSALLVALGLFYRFAIVAFWLLFTYAELMDVTGYLNHYYFISMVTFIMCFLSPHGAWSIDAILRPKIRRDYLPSWQTYWLRFQVGLLYFYAGLAKFESDWLLHAQPLNIWLPPHSGLPLLGPLLELPLIHHVFSWFAFLFDTLIIAFMLWRKTRLYAFFVILVFHYFTYLFFNIGLFPLIMVFSVLIFFDADWPRKWLAMAKIPMRVSHLPVSHYAQNAWISGRAAAIVFVVAFCLVQFITPLRHLGYPGSVLWHEQGMRYSWRVMLREKTGSVQYRVVDSKGSAVFVSPRRYLTEDQYREMSGQPDLILQLGHHISEDFNNRGVGPVEVYADARVSLNGRQARPIIYPDIDLTKIKDGMAPASWITPSPEQPPPLHRALKLVNHP